MRTLRTFTPRPARYCTSSICCVEQECRAATSCASTRHLSGHYSSMPALSGTLVCPVHYPRSWKGCRWEHLRLPILTPPTVKRCSGQGCPHCLTAARNYADAFFKPYSPPRTNFTTYCLHRGRSAITCVGRLAMSVRANMTASGVL